VGPALQDAVPAGVTVVYSKWSAQLYGFVELDSIYDSTQSYIDLPGGSVQAAPGSYAESHPRVQFSVRNSRLGFKLAAPEFHGVRASGVIEADFLGNQNTVGNPTPSVANAPSDNTEAAFFNNPGFRIRHAYVKLEDRFIDFLAGQTWELFGWQGLFQPNTVQIQGVPGQVYSRTAQIRLSHVFKAGMVHLEVAGAALRPVQRDSAVPDVQAGLKLTLTGWKGWHTMGSAGSQLDGLTIAASALYRHFDVQEFAATCAEAAGTSTLTCVASQQPSQTTNGWGVSLDALIPLIPATARSHANALTLTGSWVDGSGIADQYTSMTGGVGFPTLAVPKGATAPVYSPDIDSGFVTNNTSGRLVAVNWTSFAVGLQYYLPFETLWVSTNFLQVRSPNDATLVAPSGRGKVVAAYQFADANLFWDVTPQVRLGAEYAWFNQFLANGQEAHDNRFQFSAFYIF
jgi:hypothetical protein